MSLDIGYPLYSAALVGDDKFLVTGGGGEGNNGIPNKISLLSITEEKDSKVELEVIDEFEIEGKNDSPTGIVYSNGDILLSCNASTDNIKAGNNTHLRKFKLDTEAQEKSIKSIKSIDIAKFTDSKDYIKVTKLSPDGKTLALVSSSIPSKIYLVDTKTLEVTKKFELEDEEEVLDVSFSEHKFAYVLKRKLVVLLQDEEDEAQNVLKYEYFSPSYELSKVEFTPEGDILIGVNLRKKRGIVLLLLTIVPSIQDDSMSAVKTKLRIKIRKAKVLYDKPAKITSLSIQKDLISFSTNLNSIIISDLSSFKRFKTLEKVHSFAITSVKITKDLKYIISVSVSGTVSIYQIPGNLKVDYFQFLPILYILIAGYVFYHINNYVQTNYEDQVTAVGYFLFGDDFLAYRQRKAIESTEVEVKTSYTVADGDIVQQVVESTAYVETKSQIQEEIMEEISDILEEVKNEAQEIKSAEDETKFQEEVEKILEKIEEEAEKIQDDNEGVDIPKEEIINERIEQVNELDVEEEIMEEVGDILEQVKIEAQEIEQEKKEEEFQEVIEEILEEVEEEAEKIKDDNEGVDAEQ